jgi:hypothetical protein
MLMAEWQSPKPSGQPLIVIEGEDPEPSHIYVIWDAWANLSQTERSEIIMDVIDNLSGEHRLTNQSAITVAMGLTSQEAERMGLEAA